MSKKAPQVYELVPVDTLAPHPNNPRQGDREAIRASLRRLGWYGVVVAQRSTRRVLAGWHRMDEARGLGVAAVPVRWADVDDATAERILLADNRTSDLGEYDDRKLFELLDRLDEETRAAAGYDADALAEVLARAEGYEASGPGSTVYGRMVVLKYDAATYGRVIARLEELREAAGEEDYASVVRRLFTSDAPATAN